uniref:Uncharacterized protein n=1 Tax=Meloidogyne enterolobii TaxID=390850 RepID=A0A6V7V8H6_MELEN|nr:unnamed protein product [Meloidogyne enterolobii]
MFGWVFIREWGNSVISSSHKRGWKRYYYRAGLVAKIRHKNVWMGFY